MKTPRFVVGLTGGIGSGKSTALDAFDRLGAATVSLDQLAKEQAKPGRDGYKAIVKAFGKSILKKDGTIDRAALGELVFSDEKARLKLEKATHPFILKEMKGLMGKMNGVVVVDVPLLFEKKLQKYFDATMVIAAEPKNQEMRIRSRDGLELPEARRRMKAQLPMSAKIKMADVTIRNDGTREDLSQKVRSYYDGLDLLRRGIK